MQDNYLISVFFIFLYESHGINNLQTQLDRELQVSSKLILVNLKYLILLPIVSCLYDMIDRSS